MGTELNQIYETLGVVANKNHPGLFIDDQTVVYFEKTPSGIEITCPVSLLPGDTETLYKALQFNYSGNVTLAADADDALLLAIKELPEDNTPEESRDDLQNLINTVHELRTHWRLSGRLPN